MKSRKFNQLRYWIANKISLPLVGSQFDFGGFEGKLIGLLEENKLCSNHYSVTFQCWSCCYASEKLLNLSSIYKFQDNCQETINNHISSSFHCLKCRDPEANTEQISQEFCSVPPLLILEVGHLHMNQTIEKTQIDEQLVILHQDKQLHYKIIGYTIHAALHFYMETKYEDHRFKYDGLENPKFIKMDNTTDIMLGRINCILYSLNESTNTISPN